MQLHHAAADPAGRPGPRRVSVSGSATQGPGKQQIPVGIDYGELPFSTAALTSHGSAGDVCIHRAEAGDLPGPLIQP